MDPTGLSAGRPRTLAAPISRAIPISGIVPGVETTGGRREPIGRFRILSVDGGGIRGLIPALVLRELEARLRRRAPAAQLADYFHLVAGTSTGGLIALGLTAPDGDSGRARMDAALLV